MRVLLTSAAFGLLATSAPALAQATSARDYVTQAGAGDLYEKQSSQLVLATTHDAKVRQFASHMISDHTKSTSEVKAAAMRAHLRPMPPHLNSMQADNIAQLRAARGPARDHLYVQQQQAAHQMALQLHQGYAASGDSAPLKAVAAKIAPVVQSHIDMLNGMGSMSGM